MKANNGSGNIPERDLWQTSDELFNRLDEQYHFSFDCCASRENKKTIQFSSVFEACSKPMLEKDICWMNPPFSKAQQMFEHFFKVITKGVAIYRCDNLETKTWQKTILPNAAWIFIPNKRVIYKGLEGKGARFPSAIIGLNVEPPKLEGTTLKKVI